MNRRSFRARIALPAALVAILVLALGAVAQAQPEPGGKAASVSERGGKKKCGKGSKGKQGCGSKTKKAFTALYGQYVGDDGLGGVQIVVGKSPSGPNAGKVVVGLSGSGSVTCSDGRTLTIFKAATGVLEGKAFSGTESTSTYDSTITGSFTSATTIKGSYRTVAKEFGGVTCDTGTRQFTAKYEG
jgi:hypothetical protein